MLGLMIHSIISAREKIVERTLYFIALLFLGLASHYFIKNYLLLFIGDGDLIFLSMAAFILDKNDLKKFLKIQIVGLTFCLASISSGLFDKLPLYPFMLFFSFYFYRIRKNENAEDYRPYSSSQNKIKTNILGHQEIPPPLPGFTRRQV